MGLCVGLILGTFTGVLIRFGRGVGFAVGFAWGR